MKIFVLNAGSSSLKYQLIDMENENVIAKGNVEKIGLEGSFIKYKANGKELILDGASNHTDAISSVINLLTDKENGVVESLDEISAVAHRVVQGGWLFQKSELVTEEVVEKIESLFELAPLHNPANVAGIKACQQVMKDIPQVVVFDTSFHQTMPAKAYMYGIRYEDYEEYHIRKYGAHGTSHRFVSSEVARIMNRPLDELKVITVHVGNGSSITAVDHGKSVDTTMGFTPLEGLIMGTRSGDIDPTVVQYLCKKKNMSVEEVITYLNKKCGIDGVSGVSSDMRVINDAVEQGNERAKLALDMLLYRVTKYVGAYMAAMNGADAIVFTGGIGENQEDLREYVCQQLAFAGVEIDNDRNWNLPRGTVEELSTQNSKVKVYRIPTDEELLMARDCQEIVKSLKK